MALRSQTRFQLTVCNCFKLVMETASLSKYQRVNLKLFLFPDGNEWNLCPKKAESIICISELNREKLELNSGNLPKMNGMKNKRPVIGWS